MPRPKNISSLGFAIMTSPDVKSVTSQRLSNWVPLEPGAASCPCPSEHHDCAGYAILRWPKAQQTDETSKALTLLLSQRKIPASFREKAMNVVAMPSANVPSMRDRVSGAEWNMRVQLAALYRIAAYMGLEDLTAITSPPVCRMRQIIS